MSKKREVTVLLEALSFADNKEKHHIEKMLISRGVELQTKHCKCGALAAPFTEDLQECNACYAKGLGE